MSDNQEQDLMDYFSQELDYLRNEGKEFARKYPQVASRLDIRDGESLDPHVERLIESFAFLSARIQRDIDKDYDQLAIGILEKFCPSLLKPIPALTVLKMNTTDTLGKMRKPLTIPKNSYLNALSDQHHTCRFRTVWDTQFIPLRISKITADEESLNLSIRSDQGSDLSELDVSKFDFHVTGDWKQIASIQEVILTKVKRIEIYDDLGTKKTLKNRNIQIRGLDKDDLALPIPSKSNASYCLIQEYFAFEKKFHFFTLDGFNLNKLSGQEFTLKLSFSPLSRKLNNLSEKNFKLNCVPVINIFPKMSEPIRSSDKKLEQLLIADKKNDSGTEIYSIESLTVSEPGTSLPRKIREHSETIEINDQSKDEDPSLLWVSRRQKSLRKDISGSDIFISFVENNLASDRVSGGTIYANLLCTNRRLSEQIPANTKFIADSITNGILITSLYEPTSQRDPAYDGSTTWKLTSLLTLNHFSLVSGATGVHQLREIIALFSSGKLRDIEQIKGVKKIITKQVVRRKKKESWRHFCKGIEVQIELESDAFVGSSMILFSLVLAKFFSLYTTINSFVALSVISDNQKVVEWPAMSGTQEFL